MGRSIVPVLRDSNAGSPIERAYRAKLDPSRGISYLCGGNHREQRMRTCSPRSRLPSSFARWPASGRAPARQERRSGRRAVDRQAARARHRLRTQRWRSAHERCLEGEGKRQVPVKSHGTCCRGRVLMARRELRHRSVAGRRLRSRFVDLAVVDRRAIRAAALVVCCVLSTATFDHPHGRGEGKLRGGNRHAQEQPDHPEHKPMVL